MDHDMKYVHLGRSGLRVSPLCLGTMNFGPQTSEDDSHAIMDRAHEVGINFFDTANVYGWRKGEGWTEQILGRWFAQGEGRRERTVLATKLYGSMSDWPNDTFLSARNIRLACDASLKRLQTDYIDLYQMHHVDRDTPWDEIWQAMETLVAQGKILYVGSSNFAGWHIAKAQEQARARLAHEALDDTLIAGLIAANQLQRERLSQHDMRRAIHDAHAAFADALLNAIAPVDDRAYQRVLRRNRAELLRPRSIRRTKRDGVLVATAALGALTHKRS